MKYITALFIAVGLLACHPNPANYTHPAGYKPCQTYMDCPHGMYCGFVGVDTYPVCK
jgi:hypothetical protein